MDLNTLKAYHLGQVMLPSGPNVTATVLFDGSPGPHDELPPRGTLGIACVGADHWGVQSMGEENTWITDARGRISTRR